MRRRDFLAGSAAAASFTRLARAQGAALSPKLDRISVLSNSFPTLAETWDRSKEVPSLGLDMMDLPDAMADRLHLHHLEPSTINLLSMEPSYLKKFKERVDKAKSKVVNLVVELDELEHQWRGVISPCSPDPALRAKAVEMTKQWIDIASMFECPSIMINQGGGEFPGDQTPVIEALRTLADYGKPKKVFILMENRGRATPEQLVGLMKASGTYANPDIGNFPNEEVRARGLRLMYPLARTVSHVKVNARFDFANAMKISKEMGFKGWYSIEGGGRPDPFTGMQKIIDAIVENI